jgi:malate dehydrogenase
MIKISIIGAGFVGQIVGETLAREQVGSEIVLFDIIEGRPQGLGLDLKESNPITLSDTHIYGSNEYAGNLDNSDIVVVTAGFPRKPGMDRMDLLKKNFDINKDVASNIKKYAPNAIVIYVANPVDVMTYAAWKMTGFSHNKVFGMAGVLDTSRFKAFVSMEAKVSVKDIQAMVLGGHGDSMVPLVSNASIGGVPLTAFLSKEKIAAIVERTRKGGGEIVNLLKTGSAYFAPGMATAQMVKSIVYNERRVLPVVAYLDNKYGFNDIYAGVPAIIGKNGIEQVLELKLNPEEHDAFQKSLSDVKKGIEEVKQFL